MEEQKCPLDIHMSICPVTEQKCPLDINICPLVHWTNRNVYWTSKCPFVQWTNWNVHWKFKCPSDILQRYWTLIRTTAWLQVDKCCNILGSKTHPKFYFFTVLIIFLIDIYDDFSSFWEIIHFEVVRNIFCLDRRRWLSSGSYLEFKNREKKQNSRWVHVLGF